MSQQKVTPAQAFDAIAQQIMDLPAKVGAKPQVDQLWSCLEVLKNVVEAHIKAEQEAGAKRMEQIPGVVKPEIDPA